MALEAVERDLREQGADLVVVAGDLLTWGPSSREVVEHIAARGWAVIRGNSELYLTDYRTDRAPAAWSDPAWYGSVDILAAELADWRGRIGCWPDELTLRLPDGPPIRVVHGSPRSHWEGITPITPADQIAEMLAAVDQTVVIAGHTHLAMDRTVQRWRVLNPGSVGVPLDGDLRAGYMLLDAIDGEWRPTFRRVEYDLDRLLDHLAPLAKRLGVIGTLVEREFRTARTWLAPFARWVAAHHPGAPPTRELLAEFDQADVWAYTSPHFRPSR